MVLNQEAESMEFTLLSPERHVDAAVVRASNFDDALRTVDAAFAQGRFAAKERVDLAALTRATGESYAQPELIPDALFERVRQEHAIATMVLSPGSPLSVIMLFDAKGALKGLPENERATRLSAACGVATQLRGPCFVMRVQLDMERSGLDILSADLAPSEITTRELLEHAQHANGLEGAKGVRHAVETALNLRLQSLAHAPGARGVHAAYAGASGGAGESAHSLVPTQATSSRAAEPPQVAAMSWVDSGAEVVVTMHVPAHTAKADVQCTLRADSLALHVRTLPEGAQAVVNGRLFQRIDLAESNWTLESAAPGAVTRVLTVSLAKEKQMRWLQLTRNA